MLSIGGYSVRDKGFKIIVEDEFVVTKNHLSEEPCSPIDTFYKDKNYLSSSRTPGDKSSLYGLKKHIFESTGLKTTRFAPN